MLVAAALENDGHVIVVLPDGEALLEEARRCAETGAAIDLIVTDLRMPKMSGLAAARLLRDTGLTCPILLVTAFAERATLEEANLHDVQILEKPVRLKVLRARVRDLLADEEPLRN
ncbi:MAG: glnG4 [Myxococcaceae bacterium]|nr:glnG4 [Myxococcaceae bacterium]